MASFVELGAECTNMVINTLCDEYRDFPAEEFGPDATETRLKIGEALVKITTKLGIFSKASTKWEIIFVYL